jgi:DNA polymerase-1
MERILLVDGDPLVYRFAHQHQKAVRWDAETWSYIGDESGAKRSIRLWFDTLKERLGADEVRVYLSDPQFNWRHAILPSYKGNRAAWKEFVFGHDELAIPKPGPQRPMLYRTLRDHLVEDYGAYFLPSLEADDVLGIASTAPPDGNMRIIVSPDKDMKTVPGFLFNPDQAKIGVSAISVADANWNHLYQTLVGDSVDNYGGCPQVGPKRALSILPEKGRDWRAEHGWTCVVDAYKKAGLGEEEALVMARVARVLRWGEYEKDTNQVSLWEPV